MVYFTKSEYSESFLKFWTLYRRKEAKGYAFKAWQKLDSSLFEKIYSAAAEQSKSWAARGTENRYIPLPATWLNGTYYENEKTDMAIDRARPCVICGTKTEGRYCEKPLCSKPECYKKLMQPTGRAG